MAGLSQSADGSDVNNNKRREQQQQQRQAWLSLNVDRTYVNNARPGCVEHLTTRYLLQYAPTEWIVATLKIHKKHKKKLKNTTI